MPHRFLLRAPTLEPLEDRCNPSGLSLSLGHSIHVSGLHVVPAAQSTPVPEHSELHRSDPIWIGSPHAEESRFNLSAILPTVLSADPPVGGIVVAGAEVLEEQDAPSLQGSELLLDLQPGRLSDETTPVTENSSIENATDAGLSLWMIGLLTACAAGSVWLASRREARPDSLLEDVDLLELAS